MKIERREGKRERRILTGMCVNKVVLAQIADKWEDNLFASKWANIVGKWCVEYYRRYQEAPQKDIEPLFDSWAERAPEDQVDIVEGFLQSLSGEYQKLEADLNSQLIVDQASEYFSRVQLGRLRDDLDSELDTGSIKDGLKKVDSFRQISLNGESGFDPFHDEASWQEAFEAQSEPLIKYHGALGQFFKDRLERDGFISLLAPEKRGKTWMLIDLAWQALMGRRRVAFFEVGDMSKAQLMRRLAVRAARRPIKAKEIRIPTKIYRDGEEDVQVDFETKEFEGELNWSKAWEGAKRFATSRLKTKETLLRVSVHPNDTLTANGIQSQLQSWANQDWYPDVVIVDYADLLAPAPGYSESRDQINSTWKRLRSISQSFHCLLITATQTDAESYDAHLIRRKHFSEDKRKFAHVTGMIGLNQSEREKELQLMRFNWVVLREDEYSEGKCVHVAGCLDIGRPCILSEF